MTDLILRLAEFDNDDEANTVADDIENAGNITYTNAKGAAVTVNVEEVTLA